MTVKITPGPIALVREPGSGSPRLPLSKAERNDLVRALNERYAADRRISLRQEFRWRGWSVMLSFGVVAGRIECTGLELFPDPEASEQSPITALALRALPLGTFAESARREYRETLAIAANTSVETGFWNPDVPDDERAELVTRIRADVRDRLRLTDEDETRSTMGRPVSYGPEHFATVAEIYTAAWKTGANPTAEVAKVFQTSRSAAAKWVARARAMGLLPQTTKGRAKGRSPSESTRIGKGGSKGRSPSRTKRAAKRST